MHDLYTESGRRRESNNVKKITETTTTTTKEKVKKKTVRHEIRRISLSLPYIRRSTLCYVLFIICFDECMCVCVLNYFVLGYWQSWHYSIHTHACIVYIYYFCSGCCFCFYACVWRLNMVPTWYYQAYVSFFLAIFNVQHIYTRIVQWGFIFLTASF